MHATGPSPKKHLTVLPQSAKDLADLPSSFFPGLTLREQQVARYVSCGCSNKVIAIELGVSQRTIEAHRARVFQKFRVRNAVQLAWRVASFWQSVALRPEGLSGHVPAPPVAQAATRHPPEAARRPASGRVSQPDPSTRQRAALIARGWDLYPLAGSGATPAKGPCRPAS